MLTPYAIAQRLPDLPRWVEVRSALRQGAGEVFGLQETPELSLVLWELDTESVFVVGRPGAEALRKAIRRGQAREVIAPPEQADLLQDVLPGWAGSRILLHVLPDERHLPIVAYGQVGFLDASLLKQFAIPPALLEEFQSAALHSPIAAAFVEKQPVSFCYAGAVTEAWWDISIDTLPEHRRKGYAALCVAHMIRHMQSQGKQPVWAAITENPASWRLAQKLGFTPVDELVLFELSGEAVRLLK